MKKFTLTLFIVVAFWIQTSYAQPVDETFTTSGFYTIPDPYSAVLFVEVWGGGGGGGTGAAARGGGGGGGYSSNTIQLSAGTYPVTVGFGGPAGVAGGSSSFEGIVAGGGGAGGNPTGGLGGFGDISGDDGMNAGSGNGGDGGNGANGGGAGGLGGVGMNASGTFGGAPGGGGGGKADGSGVSRAGARGEVIITVLQALPVELISFRALAKGALVNLSWVTGTETDNEKFQIERSKDGVHFETIGEVAGAGTTVIARSYTFADESPKSGANYYRLKQMDFDGNFEYSSTEVVIVGRKNNWYLKTANGTTTIFFDEAVPSNASVQMYDNAGKQVWQSEAISEGVNILEIPVSSLSSGQYFVRVITKEGATAQAFFKN